MSRINYLLKNFEFHPIKRFSISLSTSNFCSRSINRISVLLLQKQYFKRISGIHDDPIWKLEHHPKSAKWWLSHKEWDGLLRVIRPIPGNYSTKSIKLVEKILGWSPPCSFRKCIWLDRVQIIPCLILLTFRRNHD